MAFPSVDARRAPPRTGTALDGCGRLLARSDLFGGRGDDGVQVTHDTEVGELEDRRLGVLVDGDDGLRGLHAGAVLDRTGDADRDVELRRHGAAGLPDLVLVRVPAGIRRSTRGPDGGTEGVGELLHDGEVL